MREARRTRVDYPPEAFERVRQTCLHVATVLGDTMERVTLVGGAVPSLLIPPDRQPEGTEPHPGTTDMDLGLELALLEDEGYAGLAELLRGSGYRAEQTEQGRTRRQTWRTDPALGTKVTIDFLIPRSPQASRHARLQNLEPDFAAIIADGLQLVARDRRQVRLSGQTLRGEVTERDIWVCGPASYVVLKARAVRGREMPKDAFDLHYVLANIEGGVPAVAADLRLMLDDSDAAEAVSFLRVDYATADGIGPSRAAYFAYGEVMPETQAAHDYLKASAHAFVQQLLRTLG